MTRCMTGLRWTISSNSGASGGRPGTQAFKLAVRLTEQIGQELGRDVERDGNGPDSVLPRRLNHRRRKARLREEDPDRGHGRRAGAQVEGERGLLVGGQCLLACPNGRGVDLRELRGAGEVLREHGELGPGTARIEPTEVVGRFGTVIGEQKRGIERMAFQCLGDRPHAGCRARLHSAQVRMTDPTDKSRWHLPNIASHLQVQQLLPPNRASGCRSLSGPGGGVRVGHSR